MKLMNCQRRDVMWLSGCLLLTVHVAWVNAACQLCSLPNLPPTMMPKVNCTLDYVFKHMPGVTLFDCEEECIRRKRCERIMFHEAMRLCSLLDTTTAGNSPPSVEKCISATRSQILDMGMTHLGGCADTTAPCGVTSRCVDNDCLPSECVLPTYVANAVLMSPLTYVGMTTAYHCDIGYTGVGDPMITCLQDATWTTTDFRCYKNCPTPVMADPFTAGPFSTWRYAVNTMGEVTCKDGYSLSGSTSTITCKDDGSWEGLTPSSGVTCEQGCAYADIYLGYIDMDGFVPNVTYSSGEELDFKTRCGSGKYVQSGPSLLRTCSNGVWQSVGLCYIYCNFGDVTYVNSQVTITDTRDTFFYNDRIEFTCASSTSPTQSPKCMNDGTWLPNIASCG